MLKLEFIHRLPAEIPSSLKLYSLQKARADKEFLNNVLSRLGLASGPGSFRWRTNDGWTTAESNNTRVSINHSSGAIRFWSRLNNREVSEIPFTLEEPHLALIARTFLKKTGLVEAPIDQLQIRKIAYLRLQTASVERRVSKPKILDAGVIFGREIDGVPVSGPGGFVMINIAPDKAVTAGTKVWRNLGANVGVAKILKPDYAVKELSRRLRLQKVDQPVRVMKSEFCYFERGQSDEQRYLEPAYSFVYEYETKQNRFPYKSVIVIPAIQGSRQVWNPTKRFAGK